MSILRRRFQYLFLFVLCVAASACSMQNSSMVMQMSIYTTYRATYDVNKDTLNVQAQFNVNKSSGTFLRLDGSSKVEIDGHVMPMVAPTLNELYYSYDIVKPDLNHTYTFTYTNNTDDVFKNEIHIPGSYELKALPTTQKITQSLVVGWSAPDIVKGEVLAIRVERTGKSGYGMSPPVGALTSGEVIIPAFQFIYVGAGAGTLTPYRNRVEELKEKTHAGGTMILSRVLKSSDVTLTE